MGSISVHAGDSANLTPIPLRHASSR
jgi:hypothetical protein